VSATTLRKPRIVTDRQGDKWQEADKSAWPEVSKEKYIDMLVRVSAGLLASGHFTFEPDRDNLGVIFYRAAHGFMEPPVVEAAQSVVGNLLIAANLQPPSDIVAEWEPIDTEEKP
jgi:hypothetical protein